MDYATALDSDFLARLRSVVRRMTRDEHEAEDVVQDSLVKLLHRGGGVPAGAVRAWLITVARREAIDRSRRRRPQPLDVDVPAHGEEPEGASTFLAKCLEPMLEDLPPRDRDLLRRIDVNGESQAEIARSLGTSMSTVKSQVQRARSRLLRRLEECCTVERDRLGTPSDYAFRPGATCPGTRCGDGCAGQGQRP